MTDVQRHVAPQICILRKITHKKNAEYAVVGILQLNTISYLPFNDKSNFRKLYSPDRNPLLKLETVTVYFRRWERVEGVRQEMHSEKLLRAYVVFMVCLCDVFAP